MASYQICSPAPEACLLENDIGETPVDVAGSATRGEVLNAMLLACSGSGGDPSLRAMRALLSRGAVCDTWAPSGSSALMLTASADAGEAVSLLLEHGATLELQDALGRTALMFAAGNNAERATRALLDGGACLSVRDRRGRNILDYAAPGSNVRRLIEERLRVLESKSAELQAALLAEEMELGERREPGGRRGGGGKRRSKAKGKKAAAAGPKAPASAAAEQRLEATVSGADEDAADGGGERDATTAREELGTTVDGEEPERWTGGSKDAPGDESDEAASAVSATGPLPEAPWPRESSPDWQVVGAKGSGKDGSRTGTSQRPGPQFQIRAQASERGDAAPTGGGPTADAASGAPQPNAPRGRATNRASAGNDGPRVAAAGAAGAIPRPAAPSAPPSKNGSGRGGSEKNAARRASGSPSVAETPVESRATSTARDPQPSPPQSRPSSQESASTPAPWAGKAPAAAAANTGQVADEMEALRARVRRLEAELAEAGALRASALAAAREEALRARDAAVREAVAAERSECLVRFANFLQRHGVTSLPDLLVAGGYGRGRVDGAFGTGSALGARLREVDENGRSTQRSVSQDPDLVELARQEAFADRGFPPLSGGGGGGRFGGPGFVPISGPSDAAAFAFGQDRGAEHGYHSPASARSTRGPFDGAFLSFSGGRSGGDTVARGSRADDALDGGAQPYFTLNLGTTC